MGRFVPLNQWVTALTSKKPVQFCPGFCEGSQWGEAFWVLIWAMVGGWLSWYYWRQYDLILPILIILVVICFAFCFVFLVWGWWIAFVPSALALLATSGTVIAYRFYDHSQSRTLPSQLNNLEENRTPTKQSVVKKVQNFINQLFNRNSQK